MSLETTYLAEKKVDAPQIQEWVDTFNRQGFLFLENVLPPNWCRALREDLEYGLREKFPVHEILTNILNYAENNILNVHDK